MKVVIDTNVLLSAALRDKFPEAVIIWIVEHDDWEWVVSEDILNEYQEVIQRERFGLPRQAIEKWISITANLTSLMDVNLEFEFPRDQKDAKFRR
ncbi:MAG: putative toxin-antitoxin system toxin component, PIN family [Anaerolineales bacterium]